MSDKVITCMCKGCGMKCALTEEELISYKEKMSKESNTKYPKCGRYVLDRLDIFIYM